MGSAGLDQAQAAALARLKAALESQRAEVLLDSEVLPELLDELYEANPLREGYLRERIRYRAALLVGRVVAAVGGR